MDGGVHTKVCCKGRTSPSGGAEPSGVEGMRGLPGTGTRCKLGEGFLSACFVIEEAVAGREILGWSGPSCSVSGVKGSWRGQFRAPMRRYVAVRSRLVISGPD